jgi:glycosyltransferase involved in cell wall biosynthesis
VLEASAHAIPVVAARSGGFPEIVTDGVTGCLFTAADSTSLAEALSLIADGEVRQRIGQNARELMRVKFTPQAMGDGFIGAICEFGLSKARSQLTSSNAL